MDRPLEGKVALVTGSGTSVRRSSWISMFRASRSATAGRAKWARRGAFLARSLAGSINRANYRIDGGQCQAVKVSFAVGPSNWGEELTRSSLVT
jgi:hypothetical protein